MTRRSKGTSNSDDRSEPGAGTELLVVNGWRIAFHTQLLLQLERLIAAVEKERRDTRVRRSPSQPALILASLRQLMFVDIPADPTRPIYRQGSTLGGARKHWFRAKFGNGRYRLFFRFSTRARLLLFAWVNDEESLRTYGSSTDVYATFARMLDGGDPPDDWDSLLKACTTAETLERLQHVFSLIQRRHRDE
jgi:toxin YhaV